MSISNTVEYKVDTITLLIKQLCAQAMIDEKLLADRIDVRVFMNHYARQLVAKLKYHMAYQRLGTKTYAADWWSGLKLALFGERYWEVLPFIAPPEMVTFEIDAEYPDYKLPSDTFGQSEIRISTARYSALDDWIIRE